MKNKLTTLFILLVIGAKAFGSGNEPPKLKGSIKLEGSFYADNEGLLNGLTVEIVNLQTNELEDIYLNKPKAKLELNLGYKYMVYIKKRGYATKKILVDAREAMKGDYKFEFDMKLHTLDEKFTTQNFRPICILRYNRFKQKFVYDSDYTDIAKKELEHEVYSKR